LRGPQLQLSLLAVLQELGRPQDRVHDRAQIREDRGRRRTRDQNRILDSPPRIEVGPIDQRQIDDDQEEDQQVDDEANAAVEYEECERHGNGEARVYVLPYGAV